MFNYKALMSYEALPTQRRKERKVEPKHFENL